MVKSNTIPAGSANKGLRVTAVATTSVYNAYWRGGQKFSKEPRVIALSELTPEQVKAILDDSRPGGGLVVTEEDVPASAG